MQRQPFFRIGLLIAGLLILLPAHLAAQDTSFTILKTNRVQGIIPDINDAYGVVFRDLNNDNNPDLYFVCFRNFNRLLINNGGLIPFVDRTISSGTGGYLMTSGFTNLELGAACADYDNDGLPDLFLAGWGKTHTLFHNRGQVRFEDATANLNAWGMLDANQGVWLDADNNGFLDLYVTDEHHGNRLFINRGNGFFEERVWSEDFIEPAVSQGAATSDIDLDGDMDLYICNWFEPDYLLINNGEGVFERRLLPLSTLTDSVSTNSAAFADTDNDGDMDLYVAGNNGRVYHFVNNSLGDTLRFRESFDHPFARPGGRIFGLLFRDFDLDGWLDALITGKGKNRLYFYSPDAQTFDGDFDSDETEAYSTGSAAADLDSDGDLDIVISNKDENSEFYLNPLNKEHYIIVRLKGVRSNSDAIGSKVFFYAGPDTARTLLGLREVNAGSGYLSSSDPRIYFGTAERQNLSLRIVFPSGEVIEQSGLQPGMQYTFYEHRGLSNVFFSSLAKARILINRADFWLNFFLVLAILLTISAYIALGQQRYSWSARSASLQLFMWFVLFFFLFLFFKGAETKTMLSMLLGLALFGTALSVFYNEHFLRQRRQRERVRGLLHDVAERLLQIHNNKEMAIDAVKAISRHPDVRGAAVYLNNANNTMVHIASSWETSMPRKVEAALKEGTLQVDWSAPNGINITMPISRKGTLLGFLALNMQHPEKAVNREDFRQIQAIAGQMSIAIENNAYIDKTSQLIEELTAARVRDQYVKELENSNRQLDTKNRELQRLFRELQQKEAQLVHSEKMASLGQLVAGISHELNNPISFIYSNMSVLSDYMKEMQDLLREYMPENGSQLGELLEDIESTIVDSVKGSKAVKEIVQNLKNFSRIDQAQWKESNLAEMMDTCLKILKPHIRENIDIQLELKDNPEFFCNPGQLNQVFINLIINALQALQNKGRIVIASRRDRDNINITISDNGPGIEKENLTRIFDPFFTTKPVNKGTGLGLSISYSIIQKHQGNMSVESKPGRGTTFKITLPLNLSTEMQDERQAHYTDR